MEITLQDIETLFRPLRADESAKAAALIPVVLDTLRQEAFKRGKNLDQMIEVEELRPNVLKSVAVDIIGRNLMTSTDQEPMSQFSQSALGYSVSGTFLTPGGGLFVKKSELARLGLLRQKIGMVDIYGLD